MCMDVLFINIYVCQKACYFHCQNCQIIMKYIYRTMDSESLSLSLSLIYICSKDILPKLHCSHNTAPLKERKVLWIGYILTSRVLSHKIFDQAHTYLHFSIYNCAWMCPRLYPNKLYTCIFTNWMIYVNLLDFPTINNPILTHSRGILFLRLQAVEYVWEVVLGWSHDSVVDCVPDKQCFSCVTRGRG